ncbi:hypothetical protein [Hoeflea poritis]|uniref:Glycosyltransferase 2-like domain-containing protein n=1 Tax=Hoeflea poritis TaxID=2993659 RepID=A0ABT4VNY4_9HYPH|nr:hypothetical protein [Hoeflea poritis]MDA4846424.1 hypothetical protein [Hoeflea poritis]
MISIIIAGRNDNYGGDFEDRLFSTSRYNVDALRAHGIEFELIFVEWNPLPDRELLSEKVMDAFPEARCIVVDGAIHRLISENRHIAVFEYHAKNAGAARAKGDWILITNPDNFLGGDVLQFLQQGAFDANTLYRAGRIDIADETLVDSPDLEDDFAHEDAPFFGASGDFIFCSAELFRQIGGFREDLKFTNTAKDVIFCQSAFERTGQAVKIGCTYHLSHGRPQHTSRRIVFAWHKVSRLPQKTFGLADDDVIATTHGRITRLTLPDHLLGAANGRQPPDPAVPHEYRVDYSLVRQPRKALLRFMGRL